MLQFGNKFSWPDTRDGRAASLVHHILQQLVISAKHRQLVYENTIQNIKNGNQCFLVIREHLVHISLHFVIFALLCIDSCLFRVFSVLAPSLFLSYFFVPVYVPLHFPPLFPLCSHILHQCVFAVDPESRFSRRSAPCFSSLVFFFQFKVAIVRRGWQCSGQKQLCRCLCFPGPLYSFCFVISQLVVLGVSVPAHAVQGQPLQQMLLLALLSVTWAANKFT